MKARIVKYGDDIQLLLCSGQIKKVSTPEILSFLKTFLNPSHYEGAGWTFPVSMEEYNGETIGYVNDEMELVLRDSSLLSSLDSFNPNSYITTQEYADMHGKQISIIKRLCNESRIEGAVLKGRTWLIPADAPYPDDTRKKR